MEKSSETAFKNWINHEVVQTIADEILKQYPVFDKKSFLKVSGQLQPLELKNRVLLITSQLQNHLPEDYKKSLSILHKVIRAEQLKGFSLWPFSEYISQRGLDHLEDSLAVMYDMTSLFSAEFCIRPFFIAHPEKVLKQFEKWSRDDNVHIRRWVSEGSRPLLPWGQRIDHFRKKPELTAKLLAQLRFDPELYVRKSVANHLNDISKDHPEFVIRTLKQWQTECSKEHLAKLEWIKRHSLRTLIKKGHPKALQLMGVGGTVKALVSPVRLTKKNYKLGEALEFEFQIKSTSTRKQKLVVDYSIHFVKKNGTLSPKVFKLKSFDLLPGSKVGLTKRHSLKKITTMVYNSGAHKLAVHINGKPLKEATFVLKV